jgi:uncharacterized phage-like protein YoqJ
VPIIFASESVNYRDMKSWEAASLRTKAVEADPIYLAQPGTIALNGSRDVDRKTARAFFEKHLSSLLHQGRTWVLAGSRGIDQWAIEWLSEHDETCWVVVPYSILEQPRAAQEWLEQADRVIELRLPRRKSAGAVRNRYVVDVAEVVFGFWSGKGGNTIKSLRHALRKRKEVHGIPISNKL